MWLTFFWLIGFLCFVGLIALQMYVIKVIGDFEEKNQNPIEPCNLLNHTTLPTIILYSISLLCCLITFSYSWLSLIIQTGIGCFFYYNLIDITKWFPQRYLYRDLKKIKIRHSALIIATTISAILSLLIFILK